MLVPGVGGSLMMLVMGIYALYIEAVSTLNIILLVTFGISMVLGVLAGIIITKKILELFYIIFHNIKENDGELISSTVLNHIV